MRLKTVILVDLLMALIGLITTACSGMKPDPNPYGFVDSRQDGEWATRLARVERRLGVKTSRSSRARSTSGMSGGAEAILMRADIRAPTASVADIEARENLFVAGSADGAVHILELRHG